MTGGGVDVPSGRQATMATPKPGDPRLAQLSLNQRTIKSWSVEEAIAACVRYGIPAIGLWREPVEETGLEKTARLVREAGLRVSSLCRAGFLTSADPDQARAALDSTFHAVEETAELEAACLPIIPGGLSPEETDLGAARRRFVQAFDRVVASAQDRGVTLGLEPLHPMFCADRSVVVTLSDALGIIEEYPSEVVGVIVDSYNVWWDPALEESLARAEGRIVAYQVSDWVLPLAGDVLLSRGMPGDGYIDLPALGAKVAAAGYAGDVEMEIFNEAIWSADPDDALQTILRRHAVHTHMVDGSATNASG